MEICVLGWDACLLPDYPNRIDAGRGWSSTHQQPPTKPSNPLRTAQCRNASYPWSSWCMISTIWLVQGQLYPSSTTHTEKVYLSVDSSKWQGSGSSSWSCQMEDLLGMCQPKNWCMPRLITVDTFPKGQHDVWMQGQQIDSPGLHSCIRLTRGIKRI